MKSALLFIAITCFSFSINAAELLPGYVVMANNDTVECKIKGGRYLRNPFHGVTIINEKGLEEFLPSNDKKIIAFGFVEKLKVYDYMFIDVGDKLENGFYQLIVNGPKYKLYGNPTTIYGGNPTYVLFNQLAEFRKFEPCVACPWKKKLRELLKNDSKALARVENAPRVNIPKFIVELNEL